jgi:hypothetical protein
VGRDFQVAYIGESKITKIKEVNINRTEGGEGCTNYAGNASSGWFTGLIASVEGYTQNKNTAAYETRLLELETKIQ